MEATDSTMRGINSSLSPASPIRSPGTFIEETKTDRCKRWVAISPASRLSDFSIEYILSPFGPGGRRNSRPYRSQNVTETYDEGFDDDTDVDGDSCSDFQDSQPPQFDWLHCTRYRPPKLQRKYYNYYKIFTRKQYNVV